MIDTQTRYLWLFVAALVFLSGLFTWSMIYRHSNTFAVGSRPIETPVAADPTLPPIRLTDARLGSTRSDATEVVEFGSYQCLHCRAMTPDLLAILSDSTKNVRLIWREAPVQDQSRESLLGFAAARCAHMQNRFSDMHPALYQLGTITDATVLETATNLKMNISQFQACLNNTRIFENIRADQQVAIAANILAAPTLFVHGKPYVGLLDQGQLQALLK